MEIAKLSGVYRETNLRGFAWRAFSYFYKNVVRVVMPYGEPIMYSGVSMGSRRKIGDWILPKLYNPPEVQDLPGYEEALVSALKTYVRPGDAVVVVGVGFGVTCIVAAQASGEHGRVKSFEGDAKGCESVLHLAVINKVSDRISVQHAIVAENISVYGDDIASCVIDPKDLPVCDVLELDCEGAEIAILSNMTIRPRIIAVETHGFLGAPTPKVHALLESIGYVVQDMGWAEPRLLSICIASDVRVLVGTLID
jgi:hypothetical protein